MSANSTECTTETSIEWHCEQVPIAIAVCLGAGLATGVGGAIVFFPAFVKSIPQSTLLAISLALSAGVMLYVSFIEIFVKSQAEIATTSGISEGGASAVTTACFFGGMLFCVLLELLVSWLNKKAGAKHHCPAHCDATATWSPNDVELASADSAESATQPQGSATCPCPAHPKAAEEPKPALAPVTMVDGNGEEAAGEAVTGLPEEEREQLGRMGLLAALAIAVHNFPEGLATFMATLDDYKVGASLGTAIAVHNIPEGICVAMPIYYATGSKWKAFGWSLLSGITEPIGGIIGFAALQPVFTPLVFGIVFSMVGGMMVFIVMHELLPAAHRYMGNGAKTTAWLIFGMFIMALSLVLMQDFNNSIVQEE